MADLFGKSENKIYRGAYNYYRNDKIYCEETFDVFRDKKEMNIIFVSEMLSRVATGEILTINVNYIINKNFIPKHVSVRRSLGEDTSQEFFDFDERKNLIKYRFIDFKGEENELELNTNPKFHITTPNTCTSMLFIRSKKFDATSKNHYTIFTSPNQWRYKDAPKTQSISLQRISMSTEPLSLEGGTVQAMQYKLYEESNEEEKPKNKNEPVKEPAFIRAYLSQYITIPYMLRTDDGTRIQIKYLNNLDQD